MVDVLPAYTPVVIDSKRHLLCRDQSSIALKAAPGRSFVMFFISPFSIPGVCTELFKSREEASAAPAAGGGSGSPRTRPGGSISHRWKAGSAARSLCVAEALPKPNGFAEESSSEEFAQVSWRSFNHKDSSGRRMRENGRPSMITSASRTRLPRPRLFRNATYGSVVGKGRRPLKIGDSKFICLRPPPSLSWSQTGFERLAQRNEALCPWCYAMPDAYLRHPGFARMQDLVSRTCTIMSRPPAAAAAAATTCITSSPNVLQSWDSTFLRCTRGTSLDRQLPTSRFLQHLFIMLYSQKELLQGDVHTCVAKQFEIIASPFHVTH